MNTFGHWTNTDVLLHNARVAGWKEALEIQRAAKPSDDPESSLHDYILEYCHARGWLVVHSRLDKPTTTAVGVADFLIYADYPRAFIIEAKRPGCKLRPKQRAFLFAASALGWPQAVVHSPAEFDAFIASQR